MSHHPTTQQLNAIRSICTFLDKNKKVSTSNVRIYEQRATELGHPGLLRS